MAQFDWTPAGVNNNYSNGLNWKVGGVQQAAPPTNADDARFASGSGNVVVDAASVCKSFVMAAGYANTMSGAATLNVKETFTLVSTATVTYTGIITFSGTTDNGGAGWPITVAGRSLRSITWNGVGGFWTTDGLTYGGAGTAWTVTNGKVSFASRTHASTNASPATLLSVGAGGTVDLDNAVFNDARTTPSASAFVFNAACTVLNGATCAYNLTALTTGVTGLALGGKVFGSVTATALTSGGVRITGTSGTVKALTLSATSGAATGLQIDQALTLTLSQADALTLNANVRIHSDSGGAFSSVSSAFDQHVTGLTIVDSHAVGGGRFVDYAGTDGGGNTGWRFMQSTIGESVQCVWKTRVSVGESTVAAWPVRAAVGESVQCAWRVRAAVGGSVVCRWPVRTAVGESVVCAWRVRAAVGESTSCLWHVRAAVGESTRAVWPVRSAVGESVQVVWSVRTSAGESVAAVWPVRAAAGSSVSAVWPTRAAVGESVSVVWPARNLAGSSAAAVWPVRTSAGSEVAALWPVRAPAGSAVALVWPARALVGDDLTVLWRVQSAQRGLLFCAEVRTRSLSAEVLARSLGAEVRTRSVSVDVLERECDGCQ